ncbi:MAG: SprT family zinc-dependent metalloprotease [Tenuifilaceae bacterium]|jgi:hypothetical protein|nr:SprT family zinc-dependent metalloprotease [Bacteroidales bacterium]MDI9517244.1 SprT family zinc-dependent metalloprotease [Bacteroidota bacterium]NLH56449.1 M48 family metallopeptidase [Rikenellaceae bacterium]OQC62463.1 MAG: WLM domain protein [Bacteroidetes bacterium ADurb.Bin008]HNV82334.1 SprT family zinc-dependent metalloprotease [Tenuifilaceae bacterium]
MTKRLSNPSVIHVEGVGKVKFQRNFRAKRLSISIRPRSGVRITVPRLLPLASAKEFVLLKKDWIVTKLQEIDSLTSRNGTITDYQTKYHRLKYYPSKNGTFSFDLSGNELRFFYPAHRDISDEQVQEAVRKAIEETLRAEALQYLPFRLKELANEHNFHYNSVRIKNIRSRWGSCSANNNINLSIYLMKLPDELIDYVILHELTHTIHKNHGKDFWDHLEKVSLKAKVKAARVRKYRTGV